MQAAAPLSLMENTVRFVGPVQFFRKIIQIKSLDWMPAIVGDVSPFALRLCFLIRGTICLVQNNDTQGESESYET